LAAAELREREDEVLRACKEYYKDHKNPSKSALPADWEVVEVYLNVFFRGQTDLSKTDQPYLRWLVIFVLDNARRDHDCLMDQEGTKFPNQGIFDAFADAAHNQLDFQQRGTKLKVVIDLILECQKSEMAKTGLGRLAWESMKAASNNSVLSPKAGNLLKWSNKPGKLTCIVEGLVMFSRRQFEDGAKKLPGTQMRHDRWKRMNSHFLNLDAVPFANLAEQDLIARLIDEPWCAAFPNVATVIGCQLEGYQYFCEAQRSCLRWITQIGRLETDRLILDVTEINERDLDYLQSRFYIGIKEVLFHPNIRQAFFLKTQQWLPTRTQCNKRKPMKKKSAAGGSQFCVKEKKTRKPASAGRVAGTRLGMCVCNIHKKPTPVCVLYICMCNRGKTHTTSETDVHRTH
jgi:hypothetical protein